MEFQIFLGEIREDSKKTSNIFYKKKGGACFYQEASIIKNMAKGKVITLTGEKKSKAKSKEATSREKTLKQLNDSLEKGHILTGQITGVTEIGKFPTAVVLMGGFRVLIPAKACVPLTEKELTRGSDAERYVLNKRLSSEIDFIIESIDMKNEIAIGNRFMAMEKRREMYFEKDDDGEYILYQGVDVEARVVASLRAGILVEIFGHEVFIPSKDLDYQRVKDATEIYSPGQVVVCRLMKIERNEEEKTFEVEASIKATQPNPYVKLIKQFESGSRYTGEITHIDKKGNVFVRLDAGMDILCKLQEKGESATVGMKVTVVVTGKNEEMLRLFGHITHMSRA